MFVVVREPNIEILPVICESLKIVLPSVKELADTELNTTFDVDDLRDGIVSILEYSISGSGNEQGMDYIVP